MKSLLVFIALLAINQLSIAQGLPSIQDIRAITDKAMEKVSSGNIEDGLNSFKEYTIVPTAEFDALVGQSKNQWPLLVGRFGKSVDYEFIEQREVGNYLASLVYIHRFEKHAMRWMFYLYRGKNGWVINTFRFDDQWPQLLDQK